MKRFLFNKALRILLITNGIILVAGAMLAPIYALFVEGIGGNLLDASLTGAIFAIAAGITTLIMGRVADKVKENKYLVGGGYLAMGIGFASLSLVNSIWMLLVVQAIIGIAEAAYSPAFDAVYSRHLTKKKAGREWGAWESMNYFSIAIGAIIGGTIATFGGFTPLFLTMGLLCVLSAIYVLLVPKRTL